MTWRLTDLGWELQSERGSKDVLDRVTYDRGQQQYRDERGLLLGPKWEGAKRKCEERAMSARRVL